MKYFTDCYVFQYDKEEANNDGDDIIIIIIITTVMIDDDNNPYEHPKHNAYHRPISNYDDNHFSCLILYLSDSIIPTFLQNSVITK